MKPYSSLLTIALFFKGDSGFNLGVLRKAIFSEREYFESRAFRCSGERPLWVRSHYFWTRTFQRRVFDSFGSEPNSSLDRVSAEFSSSIAGVAVSSRIIVLEGNVVAAKTNEKLFWLVRKGCVDFFVWVTYLGCSYIPESCGSFELSCSFSETDIDRLESSSLTLVPENLSPFNCWSL